MELLVVTPHTDDMIYGTAGTLIQHAGDAIHIVAVSGTQKTAARDVARELGATIEFLDAPFHRISDEARQVKDGLAAILREHHATYIFGPPATGDWTADHTTVGSVMLDALNLAGNIDQYPSRYLRYPIPATTREFRPNVWVDLPLELVERKIELAAIMTRGLEDEWPRHLVEWEVNMGLRFAQDVGWPCLHAEAFDGVFAVPFRRLPGPDQLPADDIEPALVNRLVEGVDLSAG